MDNKNRIEVATANLKRAEQTKTIKETQLQAAEQQRANVIEKMGTYGVTPETIGAELEKLNASIDENLSKVEGLIPTV